MSTCVLIMSAGRSVGWGLRLPVLLLSASNYHLTGDLWLSSFGHKDVETRTGGSRTDLVLLQKNISEHWNIFSFFFLQTETFDIGLVLSMFVLRISHIFSESHTQSSLLSQPSFLFSHSGVSGALGRRFGIVVSPHTPPFLSLSLLPLHGCSAEFLTYQTGQTAPDGHSRD